MPDTYTKLQMEALDIIYAYRQDDSVISALKSMKEGSDREFKRIFAEATTLGKQLHGENFELEQPRVNKHQMHQSNIPATTAEAIIFPRKKLRSARKFLGNMKAAIKFPVTLVQSRHVNCSRHG